MASPDFRALCAELVTKLEAINDLLEQEAQIDLTLLPRARAALAQPAPVKQGPTYSELFALIHKLDPCGTGPIDLIDFARAVLARWGQSSICTGCNTPRHEAIAAVAAGKAACCPDCSTLSVDDRNAIRAIAGLEEE